jgi:hypothetical protein
LHKATISGVKFMLQVGMVPQWGLVVQGRKMSDISVSEE